jgi:hypothetical protein
MGIGLEHKKESGRCCAPQVLLYHPKCLVKDSMISFPASFKLAMLKNSAWPAYRKANIWLVASCWMVTCKMYACMCVHVIPPRCQACLSKHRVMLMFHSCMGTSFTFYQYRTQNVVWFSLSRKATCIPQGELVITMDWLDGYMHDVRMHAFQNTGSCLFITHAWVLHSLSQPNMYKRHVV